MLLTCLMALFALITCNNFARAAPAPTNVYHASRIIADEHIQGIETVLGRHLPHYICKLPGTTCHPPADHSDTSSVIVTRFLGHRVLHLCKFGSIMCNFVDNKSQDSDLTIMDKRALIYGAPWSSCGPPGFICAVDGSIIPDTTSNDEQAASELNDSQDDDTAHADKRALIYGAPWSSCGPPGFICAVDGSTIPDPASADDQDTSQLEERQLARVEDENNDVEDTDNTHIERRVIKLSHGAPWSSCGPPGFICAYEVDEQLLSSAIPMAPSTLATYGLPTPTST